jgi:hypothetical protein
MPLYTFLDNLLNALLHVANRLGLQENATSVDIHVKTNILYFSILLRSLTLNICSFVRQCNTFTSRTLSRHVSASHGHHQL